MSTTLVMSVAYVESLIIPSSSGDVAVESTLDSVKPGANELDSNKLESVESLPAETGSDDEASVVAANSSSVEF